MQNHFFFYLADLLRYYKKNLYFETFPPEVAGPMALLIYFSKGRTASHSFPIHFRDRPRTPLPLTYTLYECERAYRHALFGPWRKGEEMKEERRRELVFICLKLECSCFSCQCEYCIAVVPVAVAKLSLKPVQNQNPCEITINTAKEFKEERTWRKGAVLSHCLQLSSILYFWDVLTDSPTQVKSLIFLTFAHVFQVKVLISTVCCIKTDRLNVFKDKLNISRPSRFSQFNSR